MVEGKKRTSSINGLRILKLGVSRALLLVGIIILILFFEK